MGSLEDPALPPETRISLPARPVRTADRLLATGVQRRRAPSPSGIARRRWVMRLTKLLLPVAALVLLATIALWPEIARLRDEGRVAFSRLRVSVDGAELSDARYRGVDDHGRPYTLSADSARQTGDDRVDLVQPKGDITQENNSWIEVQAKRGVMMKKANQLDLWDDVILYRDDGTTMRTASASVDLRQGAAAGSEHVSADGPFGTLEASGFTLTDRGSVVQFSGPVHLVLNGQP